MYAVTPKNIRLRYLAAKDDSLSMGQRFTYDTMGEMFIVSGQACYMWTLPQGHHSHRAPRGRRYAMVKAWINDGRLDAYIRRVKGATQD